MYINRKLEKRFEKFLNDKEILAVIGPRQAGKTTMINYCLEKIKHKKINKISFDDLSKKNLFEENINAFIESEVKEYDILFIDEVQYVKDSGQKLKYIYDNFEIKIIISGSSGAELSLQSIKYVVGRIIVFELQTLSFEEFLEYKDNKLFNICKKSFFSKEIYNQLKTYINEYLTYGGYPRVVLEDNKSKKKEILKNILNTYLLKEISEILQYKENRIIETLARFLASQIGGIINYEDLSAKVGVSVYDIKNAMYILEKTFVCSYSLNYHTNRQTELVKSPKVFFYDMGFRNVLFGSFEKEVFEGNIYENFIAAELLKNDISLKYWRTKGGAEVDFIIEKGNNVYPIEIKSYLNKNVVEKSLRSFIEKYKPKRSYILSLDFKDRREVNSSDVIFIPFVEFIFNDIIDFLDY